MDVDDKSAVVGDVNLGFRRSDLNVSYISHDMLIYCPDMGNGDAQLVFPPLSRVCHCGIVILSSREWSCQRLGCLGKDMDTRIQRRHICT